MEETERFEQCWQGQVEKLISAWESARTHWFGEAKRWLF